MDVVLTFISNNDDLSQELLSKLREDVKVNCKLYSSEFHWLARKGLNMCPENACDIYFDITDDADYKKLIGISNHFTEKLKIDVIAQKRRERKKELLISDMDSTIIQQECIDEIADELGLKDKVSAITERAMNGELNFSDSLRERVGLLKGFQKAKLDDVFNNKIVLSEGAKDLVQVMRKNNAICLLVSGGFTFFTQKVADMVGFHKQFANTLIFDDNNQLTGSVEEPILDKNSKFETLRDELKKNQLPYKSSLAVGDGANDLPMLEAAGLGVAYKAKPYVQEKCAARINHTNLRSLLYAQGYSWQEIAPR